MSAKSTPHYADAKGSLEELVGHGIIRAAGTTVPTDGTAGFAPGCIFQHLDGADGATVLYVNAGTATSCDFDPVFAAAQGAALTAAHATLTQAGTDSGDVAIQAITTSTPAGFASTAEGEAVVATVINNAARLAEIEARLEAAGIIAAN